MKKRSRDKRIQSRKDKYQHIIVHNYEPFLDKIKPVTPMMPPSENDKKVVEIYTKGEESYKDLLERMKKETEKFECIERDPETKEPIKVKGTRSGIIFSIGDIVEGPAGGLYKTGIAGFMEWDRYICGFGAYGEGEYGWYGGDSVSCLKHITKDGE